MKKFISALLAAMVVLMLPLAMAKQDSDNGQGNSGSGNSGGSQEASNILTAEQTTTSNVDCKTGQLIGDANGDGEVTPTDMQLISDIYYGRSAAPSNICCVDLNSDGQVTPGDIQYAWEIYYTGKASPGMCPSQQINCAVPMCADRIAVDTGDKDENGCPIYSCQQRNCAVSGCGGGRAVETGEKDEFGCPKHICLPLAVFCSEGQIIGDANNDGQVTTADMQLISDIYYNVIATPSNICCVDLNSDLQVTPGDIQYAWDIYFTGKASPGYCTSQQIYCAVPLCADGRALDTGEKDENGCAIYTCEHQMCAVLGCGDGRAVDTGNKDDNGCAVFRCVASKECPEQSVTCENGNDLVAYTDDYGCTRFRCVGKDELCPIEQITCESGYEKASYVGDDGCTHLRCLKGSGLCPTESITCVEGQQIVSYTDEDGCMHYKCETSEYAIGKLGRVEKTKISEIRASLQQSTGVALATAVKQANIESFLQFQMGKLEQAKQVCEKGNNANCAEKIEVRLEKLETLEDKNVEVLQNIVQNRLEIKQELEELNETPSFQKFQHGTKARVLEAQQVAIQVQMFKLAEGKYEEHLAKLADNKEGFKEAKAELKKCKGNEECAQAEIITREHAAAYLGNSINAIIKQLEKLRAKIEASEELSEEQAAVMVSQINEKLQLATAIMNRADSLNANSTKEEIEAVRQEVLAFWQEVRPLIKEQSQNLMHAKLGGIIIQSKQLEVKLTRIISKAVENSKDISAISADVGAFSNYINSAQSYFSQARLKLIEASGKSGDEKNTLIEQAHSLVELSKAELEQARESLKAIVQQLKAVGEEVETDEGDEAEDAIEDQLLEGE